MTVDELRNWLEEHIDEIFAFMDYEATLRDDEEMMRDLGKYWFDGKENWNPSNYRFVHLGHDGTGSDVAAWIRPGVDGPPPIVVFGSEGGTGVLTTSPLAWAQIVAHGVELDTYSEPACVGKEEDHDRDEEEEAEAQAGLTAYRKAVEARFGALPTLETLTSGLDELNAVFNGWIAGVLEG